MKFRISAEALWKATEKIKSVVHNSKIVKKTIYLKVEEGLSLYAYSQGNHGEIHLPCQDVEPGFIELQAKSLDMFEFISGPITFVLKKNQLTYQAATVEGTLNIETDEPTFTELVVPTEWTVLPKVIYSILYSTTRDDTDLENVFFLGDRFAATSRYTFAGYKHPQTILDAAFTIPTAFFDLADKTEDLEIAFDNKRIWFKRDNFYVAADTRNYKNALVTQYGYYEFEPEAFFEITLQEAERLCGYALVNSEQERAALVLKEGLLKVIPTGSELGQGTMELPCRSSYGEMNFGASVRNLQNAIKNVDAPTCKVYHVQPQGSSYLVVMGQMTRHMLGEIPSARMTE